MLRRYFIELATDKKSGLIAGLLKVVLFVLSLAYGAAVVLAGSLYRRGILKSKKPDCKVISVGNITWGGTGKTPLVLHIAGKLAEKGKVAVLLRGYGNDERRLFTSRLKGALIKIGRDRLRSAAEAERDGARALIMDDGFQHWRLARDIDIVTIDAANPFGNNRLIPRGILREPVSSLKRADIFVLTNSDGSNTRLLRARLNELNPGARIFESEYRVSALKTIAGNDVGPDAIRGRAVAALCAIGNPRSFYKTLLGLGAKVKLEISYPDHHDYTLKDVRDIAGKCKSLGIDTIITTEKDMVKLKNYSNQCTVYSLQFLSIEIEPQIKEEEKFLAGLYSLCSC